MSNENSLTRAAQSTLANTAIVSVDEVIEDNLEESTGVSLGEIPGESLVEPLVAPLEDSAEASSEKVIEEPLGETDLASLDVSIEESLDATSLVVLDESLESLLGETAEVSLDESLEGLLDGTAEVSLDESLEVLLDETLDVSYEEVPDDSLGEVAPLDESLEGAFDKTAVVSLEAELRAALAGTAGASLEEELEELEASLEKTAEVTLEEDTAPSLEELLGEPSEETYEVMPDGLSDDSFEIYPSVASEESTDNMDEVSSEVVLDDSLLPTVEIFSGVVSESAVGIASNSTLDVESESSVDAMSESSIEAVPESSVDIVSDSTLDVVFESSVEAMSESFTEVMPKNSVGSIINSSSEVALINSEVDTGRESQEVDTTLSDESSTDNKYQLTRRMNSTQEPIQTRGGAIYGLITGICAALLTMLAAIAFAPDIVQALQAKAPVGSIPYRLIMLFLLFTFTTSFFLFISKFIVANAKDLLAANVDTNRGFFNRLFDVGASRRRILAGAVGPVLLGLGQGISISTGYGYFGFSVLLDGLNKTFLVPFWLSYTVITISCYLLAWLWGRVPLGLGTVAALLLVGPAISFGSQIVPDNLSTAVSILTFSLGLFLFTLGIAFAASAALGPDGLSSLSLAAERAHHWAFSLATLLWDITAIAAGVILGGSIGMATAIGLLIVPILLHLFIPPLRRLLTG